MHPTDSRSHGTRLGLVLVAAAMLAAGGCSLSTSGNMPTTASIVVDGSSPVPVQLIVSVDFYQVVDSSGAISERYNSADTTSITFPYNESVDISSLGSISVRVRNPAPDTATVHLKVGLDNGQGFDHTSAIANGQQLSYVYVYVQSPF
jgi:hypothetical protein